MSASEPTRSPCVTTCARAACESTSRTRRCRTANGSGARRPRSLIMRQPYRHLVHSPAVEPSRGTTGQIRGRTDSRRRNLQSTSNRPPPRQRRPHGPIARKNSAIRIHRRSRGQGGCCCRSRRHHRHPRQLRRELAGGEGADCGPPPQACVGRSPTEWRQAGLRCGETLLIKLFVYSAIATMTRTPRSDSLQVQHVVTIRAFFVVNRAVGQARD